MLAWIEYVLHGHPLPPSRECLPYKVLSRLGPYTALSYRLHFARQLGHWIVHMPCKLVVPKSDTEEREKEEGELSDSEYTDVEI